MKKRCLSAAMALCISLTTLHPVVFAADAGVQNTTAAFYSDVTDIIGPPSGGNEPEGGEVILPDITDFHSNDDFKPFDPGYPKKDRYGNYTLRVPDLKGRLTFSAGAKNRVVGTLFAPGTSLQAGWKDANKKWGHIDSGLCFAASSSNLISWYLDQHKKLHPADGTAFVTEVESVFDRFRRGWNPDEGGDQKEALSWYFTGGFSNGGSQPNNNHLNGKEPGGYLHNKIPHNTSERWSLLSFDWNPQEAFDVFGGFEDNRFPFLEEVRGNYGEAPLSTLERFSAHILRQLHYGACTISITKDRTTGGAGHAITLWGADYDVETGLINGIYVTDSDDYGNRIFRVGIEKSPNEANGQNDGVRLVKYPYHGPGDPSSYTKIRDSVLLYAPGVVTDNQSYVGPDAVIDALIPDADGHGVQVQVSNIIGETVEYGYSYDRNASNVTNWQTDSHFSMLEPDQYYFFARVKAGQGHDAAGVSEPVSYLVKASSPVSQEKTPTLSLGTEGFRPYNGNYQYIWYGTESDSEAPILWRVLDTQTNHKKSGMFLLSDKLFGSGKNGDLSFSLTQNSNNYQGSNAQRWCQNFETNSFNAQELEGILSTTKSDGQYFVPSNPMASDGVTFGAQSNILHNDKVFLPSVEEMMNADYGFGTESSRLGRYHGGHYSYWLRSPMEQETGFAGHVDSDGYVFHNNTLNEYTARPAFNLNSSQVLYAAAVGNGQFTDHTGLEKIQTVQSSDFRLVLKDASRAFRVTTPEITRYVGESVTLSYEGAVVSQTDNEYISVILMDSDGNPTYYGKIAPVEAANGTISFALPDDLSTGTYTLKVFNEQYNGEMSSGEASDFCDVLLTVKEETVVEPIAEVNLTVPAPVTGRVPQKAATTESGYTIVGTAWTPNHNPFQADTHYDVTVTVKAETNHQFTSDTVFRLNGHPVTPTIHGEAYTVTYTDFPKTMAGTSGGGSSSGDTSTNTEITTGPDGSKIETVTHPDGTKVITTTWPNGDKSVTQTKKDGSTITSFVKADGTVAKTSTDKNGHIKAEVKVSKKAVQEAKKAGKPLELPISPVKSGTNSQNAPVIKVETESGGKANVTVPVSPVTFNTVAVIVHANGTEEIVRKSFNTKTGVTLSVDNGSVIKIVDNVKQFTDTNGHWAKDYIDFVTSHELYTGTSKTTFSPNVGMTRGMLAVVLHSLENKPDSTVGNVFTDVKDGEWYAKAIRWAAGKGIVAGYGNGKFGPNDQLKREQLALMLYRYAGSPAHSGAALNFRDANKVSPYAQEAMKWAVQNGIISGTGNNTLDPQGTATRAQVATMLMRLIENIG